MAEWFVGWRLGGGLFSFVGASARKERHQSPSPSPQPPSTVNHVVDRVDESAPSWPEFGEGLPWQ
jgi:hypothetical protein